MENQNSPIMQMVFGQRGNFDCIDFSEEYEKAFNILNEAINKFKTQLEEYPNILESFAELEEAFMNESAIYANDVYKEAFAYGLAMGQEVFGIR